MSIDLDAEQWARLRELRVAASPWRVRGRRGGDLVVDSDSVQLVWEPRRVTPVYAVPEADILGEVIEADGVAIGPEDDGRSVLDPTVPFALHTAPGRPLLIRTEEGAIDAFAADDPLVSGRVLVDFAALDWTEEDDPVAAHPRDPFQRIDVHPTQGHLVLSIDGVTVVDTIRATMLAETNLPVRWYVPRSDVRVPLEPSGTVTWCAYKGRATYSSALVDGAAVPDLAWSYEEPFRDATGVRGLLGFFAERMDATMDGVPLPRRGMTPPAPAA